MPSLLDHALDHLRHALPAQGPIGTFVHHNTLHSLQHQSFHDAIAMAVERTGAEGYLSEERFRAEIASGRIADEDLDFALAERNKALGHRWCAPLEPVQVEKLSLVHGIVPASRASRMFALDDDEELRGLLAGAQSTPRAALFTAVRTLLGRVRPREDDASRIGVDRTHRDGLRALTGSDPCEQADLWLVRFLAAFLDERVARWPMPGRDRGILAAATAQLDTGRYARGEGLENASIVLDRAGPGAARALITSVLDELGVEAAHWESYLERSVSSLAGWAGMVARLEAVPSDRSPDSPPVSFVEFVALRLVLDRECVRSAAEREGFTGPLSALRAFVRSRTPREDPTLDSVFRLFELFERGGVTRDDVARVGAEGVRSTLAVLDGFSSLERRRVLHEAYERQHARMVLSALSDNVRSPADPPDDSPRFQVTFCIDDREEAIRRHFEELDPRYWTYGVAGFFGIAMDWAGLDDPRAAAQCPVVVTPGHVVRELATDSHASVSRRRRQRRALAARARRVVADGTSSLVRGVALTPVIGVVAVWTMVTKVLFPRLSARFSQWLSAKVVPTPRTIVTTTRSSDRPAGGEDKPHGFDEDERVARVRATLEAIGLTDRFAPIVAVLGHGASTVNNPHHSAYECGACGGHNGGPNARAFAAMANEPVVREGLRMAGIDVPDETWFVGGWHDTTTDAVTLFDLESVPAASRAALDELVRALDVARARSAHERCRKFEHAPSKLTPERALAHVEERAVDLSQARPELGHATNAVCVVGRRSLTRGLFLDRRAFLVSYDPSRDRDDAVLERILGAVVPVGAGINLEYYFSTVDPERFGAGTKLPHNLSALLGVQEGVSGDLRTGLPRQMTEIHEPVRLLCVVEATPAALLRVAANKPEVKELVVNGWVRLVSLDPDTREMQVFVDGAFVHYDPDAVTLAVHDRSEQSYSGRMDSLPPSKIAPRRARVHGAEATR
ncbi:MAG: DUF2309 domain-containing protein [Myxococcales bacterium]|nr:DUF2309 domain-containing protein [Myxococcales bacterium]